MSKAFVLRLVEVSVSLPVAFLRPGIYMVEAVAAVTVLLVWCSYFRELLLRCGCYGLVLFDSYAASSEGVERHILLSQSALVMDYSSSGDKLPQ